MDKIKTPKTLADAIRHYSNPDVTLALMVQARWPKGVTCPTCGSAEVHFIPTRRLWECRTKHPQRQFSVKVGTIFEDSPIGLDKWFVAIWLLNNCKNGVSSLEIHRAIGVTQKTAWFMLHRIRAALHRGTLLKIGNGSPVEADETFIGGLARNMHKDKRAKKITSPGVAGKSIVMGLLDRHGKNGVSQVIAHPVADRSKSTLQREVHEHVTPGNPVFTDEHSGYFGLNADFQHEFVNHAEQYVRDNVHTNGLENFWSLLGRMLKGTYVSVEPFHLHRYVDEEAFRFNERKLTDADRFAETLGMVTGKRLTYKELTGKDCAPAAATA
jgi:transposase-like protein